MKHFFLCALLLAGCSSSQAPPNGVTVLPAGTYMIQGTAGHNYVTKAGTRPYLAGGVIVFTDQDTGGTIAMAGSYTVSAVNVQVPKQ